MTWWGVILVLAGLGVLVALWPRLVDLLFHEKMDAAARADAPGQFAQLPCGVTHYRWDGPEGGPITVLVHGQTTPCFVWDGVARLLAARGERVLRYDLLGRGYSDRPSGAQDAEFFLRQLDALLADQKVTGPVTMMGFSMGGAISASYAATRPGRVARLVLVAPAGMGGVGTGWLRALRDADGPGMWLFRLIYPGMHRRAGRVLTRDHGLPEALERAQQREADLRGFAPGVMSSLRHLLRGDLVVEHRALAQAGVPVLAIWAAEDRDIPLSRREVLAEWNPQAGQVTVPGADHWLPLTHPQAVVEAVTDWQAGGA